MTLPSLSQTTSLQLSLVVLLSVFWISLGLDSGGAFAAALRVSSGLVLLLFVPGTLLARLVRLETDRVSTFLLYAVGLSFVFLSVLVVVVGLTLPLLNVSEPFSLRPLALSLTIGLLVLATLLGRGERPQLRFRSWTPEPATVGLLVLPIAAVVAATMMNEFGDSSFMFVLVALVVAAVLLISTQYLSSSQYPAAIFLVALATFLHRSLLTSGVVGADIQYQYFLAQRVHDVGLWSPVAGSAIMSLPLVTAVPASISVLVGIPVAAVFKAVYVAAFSLVPVGIYYVATEVLGRREALFGSLFFVFYHGSFYFTPGKQLFSELFVVLLLLSFFGDGLSKRGLYAVGLLLTLGIAHSHYGSAYLLGGSLLLGFVLLAVAGRFVGDFDHRLSIVYPVVVLTVATAWYAATSLELLLLIADLPLRLVGQLVALVSGTVVGSGASYIQQETSLLGQLNVGVYLLLTGLLAVGLAWRTGRQLRQIRRGEPPRNVEYTALAIPMFVFLASSFLVIANLWADRAYQLVLVVLAPLAPVGFRFLFVVGHRLREQVGRLGDIRGRKPRRWSVGARPRWAVLAVLLSVLFLFNSGAAFAATGDAGTATFDSTANDFAFSEDERAGAHWLKQHAGFSDAGTYRSQTARLASDETVTIYTDSVTYQLFRSTIPENYYDARIVRLRSQWNPDFDRSRLDGGYVFVRKRSVVENAGSEPLPISLLSGSDVAAIVDSGDVVFENEDVLIVELDDPPTT
ncbi:transmembrane protein [Haloferax mucosum ATCC BAA-1512]|uniref:Transmembrane protein n=1 Tax=Haloferax mucosum ATCC BAA-1512 TaxID=662479 RepID=M0IMK3_9EURY|nr:DUF2206 domain-containing protein [Haloferax mucosum]ELZ98016.1 transmembrane protein [Haloferax mucosum ATCC BAA-1512]